MKRPLETLVVIAFLVSWILAPIAVIYAWMGSQAAAYVRDVAVLVSTPTSASLWLLMRKARARHEHGS